MGYVINDDEAKAIKKIIKKFSGTDISFTNGTLRGSFKIVNFRKYPMHHEVDIEFQGELFGKTSVLEGKRWFSSEIYGQKNISKIKVNKLIKEWQKGIGEPAKKEFRRLSVFLTHVRKGRCGNPVLFISCVTRHKAQVLTQHDHFPQMMLIEEFILYQQGQPSTLDAEKIKNLSALGLEWKQPPNVPRKNTGGETSRKKKPKIEPPSQEDFAGFDVGEPGLPPLAVPSPAVLLDTATLPSPGGERVMI